MKLALSFTDRDWLPDLLIRCSIRHLVRQRLSEISYENGAELASLKTAFISKMSRSDIAIDPDKANAQHYEVPPDFFRLVLGPHLKYSSGFWHPGGTSLAEAEESGLLETSAHADLHDGQSILDLGCGWGSLSLWMASRYPHSHITAVSNSHTQKAYIDAQAQQRGLHNIHVLTCDMNGLNLEQAQFDRVVSVEMFEHMRNWSHLFDRIHDWLKPDGRFFMHIFVHRAVPYTFEVRDESDWMSRYFFTGGMMPSDDLPLDIQNPFRLVNRWRWDGTHYKRTANAWLGNMDFHRESLWPLFIETYGKQNAGLWWVRWRIFFMACAELFGHREGQEWWVSHYLFEKADLT
ncbi:SAM-dependent methyltransferase [Candidatus Nitrospira neomarina]|uniref:Cyclopropane-fatty-acyl-phospholipid synthase n=1 Tax=Candidatus Nitrospira neomarina TaxID=3020899 RepID=A0AA96GL04_9BACT|nr:cyclopropane-fatty-acyl-phospholipid synthase family protein [Candidatus Nitrospira neomarina]WNM60244.1 cyclopropane-fatty-acyl-phospholipid synthase [Candidatus Nitrospira neomarina]